MNLAPRFDNHSAAQYFLLICLSLIMSTVQVDFNNKQITLKAEL